MQTTVAICTPGGGVVTDPYVAGSCPNHRATRCICRERLVEACAGRRFTGGAPTYRPAEEAPTHA